MATVLWCDFLRQIRAASGCDEGRWAAQATVSPPGDFARDPVVAVDGSGNATAGWTSITSTQVVRLASRRPKGVWQAAGTVPGSDNAENPRLATTAAGASVVAWEKGHEVAASLRSPGGAFGQAQVLSALAAPTDTNTDPRAAIGAAGLAVVVWQHWDSTANAYSIQAALARGGTFGAPQTISPPGLNSYTPDVAIDSRGNAIALFSTDNPADDGPDLFQVALAPAGGAFGPATTVDGTGEAAHEVYNEPHVVANAAGQVAATWVDETPQPCDDCENVVVGALGTTTGGLTVKKRLSDPSLIGLLRPAVGIDAQGVAAVVWSVDSGARSLQGSIASGGSFGPVARIATMGSDSPPGHQVAVGDGRAAAVWVDKADSGGERVFAASGTAASWAAGQLLSSGAAADQAQVAAGEGGAAAAVWRDYGNNSVRASQLG